MKIELLIPLWYTLKRYTIRHETSVSRSFVAYLSSMFRDYIWIPIYAIYFLGGPTLYQIQGIIIHIIAFSVAYEIGYIFTDNISIKKENENIRKLIYKDPVPDAIIYFSILIRFIVLAGILLLFNAWVTTEIIILYGTVLLIYWVYGNLKEEYRVPLFLLLRFFKGFVPYAFLILMLSGPTLTLISLLLAATACFFTIEYASRKLDFQYVNIQLMRYVWIRYLIILFFVAPYVYFGHIGFQKFSMLFTIYVAIHLIMIISSLVRRVLIGEFSLKYFHKEL
ncbi:hypothetical protein RM549_03470 [Salegentibacter sp. F188]|uniref:Uncharacterized protein n=1 Tax=Autumnicola patrickiae TaxID=3075591 RepID=A0ABU3DYM5_9FLAO|nr:hypothetical protein [Salegentibacter sp. F188]MDT0688826.1 hypothetical protein [Salegentibacter sp. F188]